MTIKTLFAAMALVALLFQGANAQTTSAASDSLTTLVGKWSGTFDGASSGKFELVINQDSNRKLTGQVIMLADDGNRYPIDLKTVVWQNGQLKASYTDADGDEVNFTGKYTKPVLKGTWKSDDGQASGIWQAVR
jgi:Rieske Fe-S protein